MKSIRTIALLTLSFLAVCGEAATSWPDVNSLGAIYADRILDISFNVTGLGSTPATLYMLDFESDEWAYNDFTKNLKNPAASPYYCDAVLPLADGKASFHAQWGIEELNALNNFYAEIFIDANNLMLARFGEDPNFSVKLDHIDYIINEYTSEPEPVRYYYDISVNIDYENGYVAPLHAGPDPLPTPEPTNGLLLLIGLS